MRPFNRAAKAVVLFGFFLIVLTAMTSRAAEPDLILHNGKVVTVDENFSIQQAVAISGERIAQTGTDEAVLKTKRAGTRLLDLGGRTVLPGLIDSHTHPLGAAMLEFDHDLPPMESIGDVLRYIRGRVSAIKPGQWIVLQQVFITRLREQRYPTRRELDEAAPANPVAFRTGPDAALNSLALKQLKIDRDFKLPAGAAGRIEQDDKGEPTGILRNVANYAKIPDEPSASAPTEKDKLARLKQLFADYNAVGITTVCDRNASPEALGLYRTLRKEDQLTVRMRASHQLGTGGTLEEIENNIRRVAEHELTRTNDLWLRIIGVKAFLDGGMLTGSAYMREPWGVSQMYGIDDPHYHGLLFIPESKLLPVVRATIKHGLQFTAHSVGDGAVHALLKAYGEVAREMPIRATRPCITHCNFMSREAVELMQALDVVADIQPIWLYLDAHTLEKQFGYERLRWFQPLATLFASGVIVGGGSDHMQKIGARRAVNPYDPFLAMATAVTRQARSLSRPLHTEEALSRSQAIRFYTSNNAHLLFLEDQAGSLEAGKLADLIVLDTDLLTCDARQIENAKVLRTFVAGKQVYERKQ